MANAPKKDASRKKIRTQDSYLPIAKRKGFVHTTKLDAAIDRAWFTLPEVANYCGLAEATVMKKIKRRDPDAPPPPDFTKPNRWTLATLLKWRDRLPGNGRSIVHVNRPLDKRTLPRKGPRERRYLVIPGKK